MVLADLALGLLKSVGTTIECVFLLNANSKVYWFYWLALISFLMLFITILVESDKFYICI